MGVEQTSRFPQDANSVKRIIDVAEAVRPKTEVYGCGYTYPFMFVCVCIKLRMVNTHALFFVFEAFPISRNQHYGLKYGSKNSAHSKILYYPSHIPQREFLNGKPQPYKVCYLLLQIRTI